MTPAPGPVRIGNGAYDQRQNDVYGSVMDSDSTCTAGGASGCRAAGVADRDRPGRVRQQGLGNQPDQGIWEARGATAALCVQAKVMCWVALDRASQVG